MTNRPPAALCENCALARLPGYESDEHRCAQPNDIPLIGAPPGHLLQRRCGCECQAGEETTR